MMDSHCQLQRMRILRVIGDELFHALGIQCTNGRFYYKFYICAESLL